MANMRDIRTRMRSVQQTLQVTSAMKLISTAKMRKSRIVLEDTLHFFDRIRAAMIELVDDEVDARMRWFTDRGDDPKRRSAVIVITSDRGMAGGYNANVARAAEELCEKLPSPFLILVGTVGQRYFMESRIPVLENFVFGSAMPEIADAQSIVDFILSQFDWEVFGEVYVVYTRMKSSVALIPETIRVLPIETAKLRRSVNPEERPGIPLEYVPSREEVLARLVPLYMRGVMYGSLIESYASEQSARMSAMDEASKNAREMIDSLRLTYNRLRQAAITQEVSEIVSGAAALG